MVDNFQIILNTILMKKIAISFEDLFFTDEDYLENQNIDFFNKNILEYNVYPKCNLKFIENFFYFTNKYKNIEYVFTSSVRNQQLNQEWWDILFDKYGIKIKISENPVLITSQMVQFKLTEIIKEIKNLDFVIDSSLLIYLEMAEKEEKKSFEYFRKHSNLMGVKRRKSLIPNVEYKKYEDGNYLYKDLKNKSIKISRNSGFTEDLMKILIEKLDLN